MHPLAHLIGKPWHPGGTGPDLFDCWHLVREAVRISRGVEIPQLGGDVTRVTRDAHAAGWRRVEFPVRDGDVIVVRESASRRHVGVVIELDGVLAVLHANGSLRRGAPVGCVERESVPSFLGGYAAEVWRLER
jgi:hypothetical protein